MNEPGPVKSAEEWGAELSPEQYAVCRCSATEPPFSGKWYRHHAEGTYVCVACRNALFGSDSKYDSGSGWPSFWQPLVPAAVSSHDDDSHGMRRIEVRCVLTEPGGSTTPPPSTPRTPRAGGKAGKRKGKQHPAAKMARLEGSGTYGAVDSRR